MRHKFRAITNLDFDSFATRIEDRGLLLVGATPRQDKELPRNSQPPVIDEFLGDRGKQGQRERAVPGSLQSVISRSRERLIPIWQEVLQRSPINVNDNFFDLGGNPELALKLFRQITSVFDRVLQPTVIFNAPTIAALAEVLDQPALPPFSPLVFLKSGTDGPPVFFAHGLGSSVLEFFELLKHLPTSRAIYGLQAKGSDGSSAPLTRIEDMAHFHLEAIRNVQPHGPYSLIGYSLGGLVALETARLLLDSGDRVALVVMIDSYFPTSRQSLWEHIRQAVIRAVYRLSDVAQPLLPGTAPVALVGTSQRARFSDFLAWSRYRPRFYNGEIKFVRAVDSDYPDPATIWPRFAPRLKLEILPGDHRTVLSNHSEDLARLLSCYLESAPQP